MLMTPAALTVCTNAIALARLQRDGRAWAVVAIPVALEVDPLARFAALPAAGRTLLWQDREWLLAQGEAFTAVADGPGRTAHLSRDLSALEARCVVVVEGDPAKAPALPAVLVASAFEERPPGPSHWGAHLHGARLWLPQRLDWRRADGSGWTIRAVAVTSSDEPADAATRLLAPPAEAGNEPSPPWPGLRNDYVDQVDDAVVLLRDGAMRKVVLARAVDEPLAPDYSEGSLLARLHALGGGTLYAHDVAGALFCGSTPEVLFAAQGDQVETMALAGSTPRGPDAAGDARQVDTLMQCTKQRKEHGLVVEHLVAGLRPRCVPFAVPDAPHPRLLERIIHLETRLAARLTRSDYLELLGALQPTPAVCGLPVATAAHYLARHERLHRGLYAGTLGWLTPDACRFIVPLRGGLIDRTRGRARLFAGAGLVETSVADEEFAETELKLSVMRQALADT